MQNYTERRKRHLTQVVDPSGCGANRQWGKALHGSSGLQDKLHAATTPLLLLLLPVGICQVRISC